VNKLSSLITLLKSFQRIYMAAQCSGWPASHH